MPIEAATKISELNPLWPLGTDPKGQGDDHLRMIKSVLQATDGGALSAKIVDTQITTSGTYTKPAGLKFLEVGCQGGGGGGGGAAATGAAQFSVGGGGGGGAFGRKLFPAAAIGATVAMTVGAAGIGGVGVTVATAGGTTSFGSLLSMGGGAQGACAAPAAAPTLGPRGTGGVQLIMDATTFYKPGCGGTQGSVESGAGQLTSSGGGGDSYCGAGGTLIRTTSPTRPGDIGVGYGAGGAGALNGPSQSGAVGAAGIAGCIFLREYF